MEKEDIRLRSYLGFLISLISFLFLSIIVKLCGLDLFYLTENVAWLKSFSDFVMSNVFINSIVSTILFIIQMFVVWSICCKQYNVKYCIKICLIAFIPVYLLNVAIIFFELNATIFSEIVPFIVCLIINKDKTWKGYLFMFIKYVVFSVFIILCQFGLMYLRTNILHSNYHTTNMFNVILLNLDLFYILYSCYFIAKIYNKEV